MERKRDDNPATFWIGSPTNEWIENTAAGSESSGYWLELRELPRGPHVGDFDQHPNQMKLTQFSMNAAHSSKSESLKITGYNPKKTASIENFKSYLSLKDHFFVHKSSNIAAQDTILDTQQESNPFPMRGTTVIPILKSPKSKDEEPGSSSSSSRIEYLDEGDVESHGRATNPVDVFNLQAGPGLSE